MAAPIMKYLAYDHLPANLQEVSKPIGELARQMDETLPDGAEKSAGLRKLLEAKDCFVRSRLDDTRPMAAPAPERQNYEPKGTRFFVPAPELGGPRSSGDVPVREMLLVTDDEPREYLRGWLLFKHPDGQWVTLRKATDDDIAKLSQAVVEAHHA